MKFKLYDRVLLKDGNEATIVEIFEENKFFLADIDKNGDTYTEEISIEDIEGFSEQQKAKALDLKLFDGKEVVVVSKGGRIFYGKVRAYFYPDENNHGVESIVLETKNNSLIEFTEDDIASIEIVQSIPGLT